MSLLLIITNAGRAALVNAEHEGTAPVTIASCGVSATAVTPTVLATSLPGEVKRIATLSGTVADADTIHVTVRDESADALTVRSIGLYLADGTLFGIYGQTATILEKTAQSILLLQVDVKFADIAASAITFGNANFLNPPATETMKGVAEIATQPETEAGTDDTRIVTPKKLAARLASYLANWGSDIVRFSNDGAGSTLDADLLDGQHGSFYANITARLGYVPWGPSNDGAGSGLDADLLDGQDSGFFTNIPARLGFTPVQMGTGVGQLSNTIKLGWSGARLKATVDATDMGNIVFDVHIADCWRSTNDGAGSGLDADLVDGWHRDDIRQWSNLIGKPFDYAGQSGQPSWLWGTNNGVTYQVWNPSNFSVSWANSAGNADTVDGYHGNAFFGWHNDGAGSGMDSDLWRGQTPAQLIASYFSSGDNINGYWRRMPDGNGGFIIEQWGRVTLPASGSNTNAVGLTFPIQFNNVGSISYDLQPDRPGTPAWGALTVRGNNDLSVSGLTVRGDTGNPNESFSQTVTVMWKAIGR